MLTLYEMVQASDGSMLSLISAVDSIITAELLPTASAIIAAAIGSVTETILSVFRTAQSSFVT
jgi:hypothetical protein